MAIFDLGRSDHTWRLFTNKPLDKADTLTTTLVVGATGMTGRSLVDQLLGSNHQVRVVVRSRHKLSAEVLNNPNATVIEASVLDLTDEEMANHVKDCGAVVSCLGHVMDFKGMFGEPKNSAQMQRGVCATRSKRMILLKPQNLFS